MKTKLFLFWAIIIAIVQGCGPRRAIIFRNLTPEVAYVRFHQFNSHNGVDEPQVRELFNFYKTEQQLRIGFSNRSAWNDSLMNEYVRQFKMVEIITHKDTLILDDHKEMVDFFINRIDKYPPRPYLFGRIVLVYIE